MARGTMMGWLLVGAMSAGAEPLLAQRGSEQDSTRQEGTRLPAGLAMSFLPSGAVERIDGSLPAAWDCVGRCGARALGGPPFAVGATRRSAFGLGRDDAHGLRLPRSVRQDEEFAETRAGPFAAAVVTPLAASNTASDASPFAQREDRGTDAAADDLAARFARAASTRDARSDEPESAAQPSAERSACFMGDCDAGEAPSADYLLGATGGSARNAGSVAWFDDAPAGSDGAPREVDGANPVSLLSALEATTPAAITTVPEPATLALVGVGTLLLLAAGSQRQRAKARVR